MYQLIYQYEMIKFLNFSQIFAYVIITIPAEVYAFGWQQMLTLPTITFVLLLTSYIKLPVFYSNNIDNCYAVSK